MCVCVAQNYFQHFWKTLEPLAPTIPTETLRFERAPKKKKKKLLIDVGADVAQTQMETQTSWLDGRSNLPHCPPAIWWPTVHRWLTIWPLAAFGHLPYAGVLFMFFIHCFFFLIFFFLYIRYSVVCQFNFGSLIYSAVDGWRPTRFFDSRLNRIELTRIESNWLESNSYSKLNWIASWPRNSDRGQPALLSGGFLVYSESRTERPGMRTLSLMVFKYAFDFNCINIYYFIGNAVCVEASLVKFT